MKIQKMWVKTPPPPIFGVQKRVRGVGFQVYKLHGSEHSTNKALSPQPPRYALWSFLLFELRFGILGTPTSYTNLSPPELHPRGLYERFQVAKHLVKRSPRSVK